ncbi:MAG: phosphoribosyl-AMP cyclohydrolase [Pseudomonadota bacterium]|nr:phosphoribosyl-AMP cyclohydrolase [Pseudomonadota bacterium]
MTINETELAEARAAWGDGLVAISRAYDDGGIERARAVAGDILESLYGFEFGPVLFKPTLSGGAKTFRTDRTGTLSYFIGHNPDFPQDTGFGLKSWREVGSQTSSVFVEGDVAMWMGWVTFTDRNGDAVKVDKSFGYRRAADGRLKLVLHHSSLPYTG